MDKKKLYIWPAHLQHFISLSLTHDNDNDDARHIFSLQDWTKDNQTIIT